MSLAENVKDYRVFCLDIKSSNTPQFHTHITNHFHSPDICSHNLQYQRLDIIVCDPLDMTIPDLNKMQPVICCAMVTMVATCFPLTLVTMLGIFFLFLVQPKGLCHASNILQGFQHYQ